VLSRDYPGAATSLRHANPFELLVSTILSAQCTDERVNVVTQTLFKKFPGPNSFAAAPLQRIESAIKSTGFFRNKARSIKGSSRMIIERHGGVVPGTMEQLLELPGVARKTANVVLCGAFGKAVGVVVDTHVRRLSQRLSLTTEKTPEKIEQDLMKILPRNRWIWFSHALILHGRKICTSRKPRCEECGLADLCPSADL
jgi:endonuclease-3